MTPADMNESLRELLSRLRRFAQWLTRDASSADDLVQLHWRVYCHAASARTAA